MPVEFTGCRASVGQGEGVVHFVLESVTNANFILSVRLMENQSFGVIYWRGTRQYFTPNPFPPNGRDLYYYYG
jgi:hypothetical protein